MVAAYRSALASNNGAGATSITMTKPSGMSTNDVMLAIVTARGGTGTAIMPPIGAVTIQDGQQSTAYDIATDGNGMWVAVGDYNVICWSDDVGATWHSVTVSAGPTAGFKSVAYGNGYFVAVAYQGVADYGWILTSTDGKTWSGNTNHQTGPQSSRVVYFDNKWVIAEQSADNRLFVNTGNPTTAFTAYNSYGVRATFYDAVSDISYNGTTWVITTNARSSDMYCVYTSATVTSGSWTGRTLSGVVASDKVYGIAWGNGTWLAAGVVTGTDVGSIHTNPNADGSGTWTSQTNPWTTGNSATSPRFANGKFVVNGRTTAATSVIVRSTPDGVNFQTIDVSAGSWRYLTSAAYGALERCWIICGDPATGNNVIGVQDVEWQLLDRKNSTTVLGQALFFKKVLASEPASWAFVLAPTALASGAIVAVSGAKPTAPGATYYSGQANASSTSVTALAIGTWASQNGVDVGLFGTAYGSSFTAPTNYTEPASSDSASTGTTLATTSEGTYRALSSVTNIGDIVATAANAAVNIGHRVFLMDLNQFSLALTVPTVTVERGGASAASDGNTTVILGVAESVTMSATALPTGVTVDFSTNPVTAGNSTTMTITASGSAVEGDSTVNIIGTAASWVETKQMKVKKKNLPTPISVLPLRGSL